MKHKVMADALTMIDDALNEDSDIKGIDRQTRILRYAKRFGGLAACLVIIGGLFILAGNQDRILLDGQKLTGDPTELVLVSPEPYGASVGTRNTSYTIEFTLSFNKATKLSCRTAEITVIDDAKNAVHTGDGYIAEGSTTIRLPLTDEISDISISTDRGYDIVLTRHEDTDKWYISLEKQKNK